jgi:dinuclear metal center YbgI/SA1388 family protein
VSMATVRDVLAALEVIAPLRFALSFDRVGLQVGDLEQKVTTGVVAMDRSLGAVQYAADCKAELLLTHHPLIFTPLASVDTRSHEGRTVIKLIQQGTSFIAAHTNWDAAQGGINDTLAEMLGLDKASSFGMSSEVAQLKLVFTCPPDSVEKVIDAASEAGAGVIGAYSRCAFTSEGMGTFIGDAISNPAVGTPGQQESAGETRVEMVVLESKAKAVCRAVRKTHPYEEPAIDLFQLRPICEQPLGRVGTLPTPMSLGDFALLCDQVLTTRSWTWGDPATKIKKVGIMGGAADNAWMDAQRAGADVLLTGEVKQQNGLEASESGMSMVAAGHYQTEHPGSAALCERMRQAMPAISWNLFVPPAGLFGRPF